MTIKYIPTKPWKAIMSSTVIEIQTRQRMSLRSIFIEYISEEEIQRWIGWFLQGVNYTEVRYEGFTIYFIKITWKNVYESDLIYIS